MKKISVITLQNVRNYGSVLQALATQKVFEDLGCEIDFYNYHRYNISSTRARLKGWVKNFSLGKRIIWSLILLPSFIRQNIIFEEFISKYIHQQKKRVCNIDDFKKIEHDADFFCTGSDQTWNSSWNGGILPEMFLDFAPQKAKKIAYAASIGKNKLDEFEIEQMKKFLLQYSAISVRESSAMDILERQLQITSAVQVLDPTLQVSKDFWLSLLSEKQRNNPSKGKFVLLYQLNTNKKMDLYAKEFAKRKNLTLIRFCTRFDQALKNGTPALIPKVSDFISMIFNANYVITDSFHASAFCCNLNTPMICIYPQEFGGRLKSLLQLFNLESRHLKKYSDFSYIDETGIDFDKVNAILERERVVGLNFLKKALNV